jgi:hypothetical protein
LADDGLLLLKGGVAQSEPLPDAFFEFVRASSEEIVYPVTADFDKALRLHGFDLRFNRAEEVQPVLYFEALRPLGEDYFIALYLLDEWAQPLGATTVDQPALVWYPTHRWQPGELVKVTFNTLPWYTRDLSASLKGAGGYRLAVGVMSGRDPWQPSARLLPVLPDETTRPYAVRLPEGGTLLELARFHRVFGMPGGGPVERRFAPPKMQNYVDASLGDKIRLFGYDASPLACDSESCMLNLVLYWQARQEIETDYTVFVHVIGEDGQMLGQRDARPDSGGYPTPRWMAGEVVADPVRVVLPSDVPASSLQVVAGMYRADTGERLLLDEAGNPFDDKIHLDHAVEGAR